MFGAGLLLIKIDGGPGFMIFPPRGQQTSRDLSDSRRLATWIWKLCDALLSGLCVGKSSPIKAKYEDCHDGRMKGAGVASVRWFHQKYAVWLAASGWCPSDLSSERPRVLCILQSSRASEEGPSQLESRSQTHPTREQTGNGDRRPLRFRAAFVETLTLRMRDEPTWVRLGKYDRPVRC